MPQTPDTGAAALAAAAAGSSGDAPEGAARAEAVRADTVARAREALQQLPLPQGWALAATGSLARGEMTEYSDVDLLILLPDGEDLPGEDDEQVARCVERIVYPLWDSPWRIDHAVRTPQQCTAIMAEDITAALALLEIVPIAGDIALVERTRARILATWRQMLPRVFDDVTSSAIARWRRSGSVVAMTRPDVKNGRGGLRDLALIRALALGNVCDIPPLDSEHRLLLDIRTLLHHATRRRRDGLDPEYAADIALALDYPSRYELSRALAAAGRTIDAAVTSALAQARAMLRRTGPRQAPRRPLDTDVVDAGDIITLSRNPRLDDPSLVLRVAAASARTGLPVAASTLAALAHCPPLPTPWPKAAVADFIAVLSSPENTHNVVRALDDHGLWEAIVPEWPHIRGRMPREASHIHTIDHHTLDTLARLGHNTVEVARPDLLLLAALYHDIGKGYDRPHEQVGAEQVARMAARMGLDHRDIMVVQTLVAEHTLLAATAARHDPTDPATVDLVLDAVHYDPLVLDLLEALAEADAQATGPTVWTHRLARHVYTLCHNARRQMAQHITTPPPARPFVAPGRAVDISATDSGYRVQWTGRYPRESVRVLALLAAKGLSIVDAQMVFDGDDDGGVCAAEFVVRGAVGAIDPEEFRQAYNSGVFTLLPPVDPIAVNTVWHGTIVEVRAEDRRGVLGALIGLLPDFRWLTMRSYGSTIRATADLGTCVTGAAARARIEKDISTLATGARPAGRRG
ncbi:[protein-PII] uridylyltransferase [Corynebacterium sp. 13CS0277]|uniref:[protein-PII] uridylyltransferase n=1 Tax=Corynebacterium sp. 13CS0277 TaxID=2071994 RepID=UPI000D02AB1B|nr:[protein-PII] uridylyltransferase [Corynebacterium sp. 13CS0277]PRQ12544.1 [protein-PII] uridylyltransferase [Corynebacterium sp. 13CS0277]